MTEEKNYYTDERIRSDLDYQRASPLFAEIYPKTACYVSEKE
jgi:hypothetical protein